MLSYNITVVSCDIIAANWTPDHDLVPISRRQQKNMTQLECRKPIGSKGSNR